MTEAPEEVAVKTVDPHEKTPTDEDGQKPSLKPSGTEALVDAPKDAVQLPFENGTEKKADVTAKEETDSAESNSKENGGGNDTVEEPVASTGEDSSAAEIEPIEPSTETGTASVAADGPTEAVSFSDEKSEDDKTSVPAPAGIEEDVTNSPVEPEGGGIRAEESSVPTHVHEETIPEGTDSSKLTDKEIPAQSDGGVPASTEEVVEEAPKSEDGSAEKSISEALDEPTATPDSLSSEATVQDSDQVAPIPDADAKEAPIVPADEDSPAAAETGEEASEADAAAVDKDLPESKGEAEGVHVADTGAAGEDEIDRDGVKDTITEEESSAGGSTDPTAAASRDEEEVKHEESTPEDATVDTGTVPEEVKDEVAESTLPEVENETDSATKVEESASVVEPSTLEEDPKPSTGLLESVGDRVISIGSGVLASAKGLVGLGSSGTDAEKGGEVPEDSTESKSVDEVDNTEKRDEEDAADPEAVDEPGTAETKLKEDELAKDSEPSTLEEDPKPSTGLLETVGDRVISVGSGVLASAKGVVGLGSSGTDAETGGEVPEDSTQSKSVDEVDITEKRDEEDAADPRAVDEPGTAETKPQEDELAKNSEPSTLEEDPKPSTGLLETVGDRVISIGSGVLATSKGVVGLGSSGTDGETGGEVPEDFTESKREDEVDITERRDEEGAADPKAVDETGTAETKPQEDELASEPSTLEEDPKPSTGLLETVGARVVSIGSGVLASTKGVVGLGSSGTDAETGGEVPQDSTESKSVDEVEITEKRDEEDAADPKAVDEPGTAETKPLENENADESQQPTVAHAEKEIPAVDEVPPDVTGSEEAQEPPLTSVSNEEKESEEEASVPSELQPATSQTEELSSRKPVDESVDESQVVPTQQESSSEVENSSSVTEAVTPDQSGSEGVTERSFHVVVPRKEEKQKLIEDSVSGPLTPCTPGGTPLIRRVEQIEKKLAQFEDKQNSPKSQKSSASTPRSSVDKPIRLARHTLEETLSKGSLLDRVAALERKLDHLFLVSGDQSVSADTSVTEEGPATNQPVSTENGTLEENVKPPLKPLRLDFDGVANPESDNGPEEPADSKPPANTEAVENLGEPDSKEKSGAEEKLAESNTAEDSKPPKDVAEDTKPPKDVADVSDVKDSDEPVAKLAEDLKSSNPPTTTTTAEGEAQPREVPAAAPKSSPAKKEKRGGPMSKLKARVKGCFASGGKKSAV